MAMIDALNALYAEAGSVTDLRGLIAEIAEDNGVETSRLVDCFAKKFGKTVEQHAAATANASKIAAEAAQTNKQRDLEEKVLKACKAYRVQPGMNPVVELNGEKYTMICRRDNASKWGYIAVRHSDLKLQAISWTAPLKVAA